MDDALGLYGDVLQVDPRNALAYADRGTVYAMMKEFDLALDDLEMSILLGHAESAVFCTMATIYFEKKQYRKALDYFSKAIEVDSNNALIYYNRSNVLYEMGDAEAAVADLEVCLGLGPEREFKELITRRLNMFSAQR